MQDPASMQKYAWLDDQGDTEDGSEDDGGASGVTRLFTTPARPQAANGFISVLADKVKSRERSHKATPRDPGQAELIRQEATWEKARKEYDDKYF